MGLIYKEMELRGPKGGRRFKALMDTGASESFIRATEARLIARPFKMAEPITLELGKGKIKADRIIFANVQLDGYRLHWTFIVISGLSEEVIVGADFFQRWKIKLDPETEKVIIDPKALRIKLTKNKVS
ncbi:MAG TPA: hypothetical protein EYP21_09045 [Syntrophaceae bacterium]|nr:hypothetical protein [Syntrophaceae bacterium]